MIGKYIGVIDGTNKGQCVLNLQEQNGRTEGFIFIYDIKYPTLNAKVELEIKDNIFHGRAHDFKPELQDNPKTAKIHGEISENGEEIKGEWETDVETEGKFHLFRHKETSVSPTPTAFVYKPIKLPACKLGIKEFAGLLMLMMKDIEPSVQPTFAVNYRGSSFLRVGIDAFVKDRTIPRIINDMSVAINEHNIQKGYKVVNLNFKPTEDSNANVSGENPTWVNGRTAEIQDYIDRYKSKSNIIFTKFGPIVNGILFLMVLILLPSINSIFARGLLMTVTMLLLLMLSHIFKNWFPKAIVYLGEKDLTFWEKNKDSILAGLITAGVMASVVSLSTYLVRNWDRLLSLFVPK